jgi:hypothetical protein
MGEGWGVSIREAKFSIVRLFFKKLFVFFCRKNREKNSRLKNIGGQTGSFF